MLQLGKRADSNTEARMRDNVSIGEEGRLGVAQPSVDHVAEGPGGPDRPDRRVGARGVTSSGTFDAAEQRTPAHRRTSSTASNGADSGAEAHTSKRPVSKRACLACREKKIKCDGEISYTVPGDADADNGKVPRRFTYKKCTNCMMAGIECVYVPSRRGGRRKKHRSRSGSSEDAGRAKRRSADPRMWDPRFYMRAPGGREGPGGMPRGPPPPPPPALMGPQGGWGFMGCYAPPPPPPPPGGSFFPGAYYAQGYGMDPNGAYYRGYAPARDAAPSAADSNLRNEDEDEDKDAKEDSALDEPKSQRPVLPPLDGRGKLFMRRTSFAPPPPPPFRARAPFFGAGPHYEGALYGADFAHRRMMFPPPPPPPHGPPGSPGMFYGYPPGGPPPPFLRQDEAAAEGGVEGGAARAGATRGGSLRDGSLRDGTLHGTAMNSSASSPSPRTSSASASEDPLRADLRASADTKRESVVGAGRRTRAVKNSAQQSNTDAQLPLFVTEEGLRKVGLPSFSTILDIVDLYYRYVDCNFKILPGRRFFVGHMEVSAQFVSVLAAIFQGSINYCREGAVENPKFLDLHYWSALYERYRDVSSLQMRLAVCILGCFRGNDDLLNESSQMIKVMDCLNWRDVRRKRVGDLRGGTQAVLSVPDALVAAPDTDVFCATTRQALAAECFIRTLWSIYRFGIFRRVAQGAPYGVRDSHAAHAAHAAHALPDFYNSDLTLPCANADYYSAIDNPMGLVAYTTSAERKTLKEAVSGDFMRYTDTAATIICCRFLEEVLDLEAAAPAQVAAQAAALERRILRMRRNSGLAPYRVSRGGVLTLNTDNTLSCAILDLALALYHYCSVGALALWPLACMPRGKSPGKPVFQRRYTKEEIVALVASTKCATKQWTSLLNAAQWALDVRTLLMLGRGILPDGTKKSAVVDSDAQYPEAVTDVPKENEVWAQLPDFIQTVALDAVVILASLLMYTAAFKFRVSSEEIVIEGADPRSAIASIPIQDTHTGPGAQSAGSGVPGSGALGESLALRESLAPLASALSADSAQPQTVLRMIEDINEYIRASAQYFEELRKVADEIAEFVAHTRTSVLTARA